MRACVRVCVRACVCLCVHVCVCLEEGLVDVLADLLRRARVRHRVPTHLTKQSKQTRRAKRLKLASSVPAHLKKTRGAKRLNSLRVPQLARIDERAARTAAAAHRRTCAVAYALAQVRLDSLTR